MLGLFLFVVDAFVLPSASRTMGEVSPMIVRAMLSLILRRAESPARHMELGLLRERAGADGVGST